jgi:hypothetical protein
VRLYAATIPFFILLPAMGISFLIGFLPGHFFGKIAPNHQLVEMPIFFSAALTVVMIVSPLALQANGTIPQVNKPQCPQDLTPLVVQFDAGTYINIKRENVAFLDRMPNFHMSVFRNNIHDLADNRLTNKLAAINPPATLFYSLDFLSNQEVFVVIDTPLLPSPGTLLSLCGVREKDQSANYNLFYVYEVAR